MSILKIAAGEASIGKAFKLLAKSRIGTNAARSVQGAAHLKSHKLTHAIRMAAAEHSPEERRRAIKFFSHLHHPQSQSVLGGDKEHSPQNIKRIIRGFGGSHLKATSSRKKVESDIKSRLHPIAKKPEAPQHQLKTQTETKLVDQKGAPIQVAGKQEAPVHKLVDQHEKPVSSAPVVEGAKETPTLGEEHKGLSTGAKVGLTLGGVALAGGGAAAIHHHHNKNKK